METSLESYRFREALKEAMNMARLGNKYLADAEPWKVIKTDPRISLDFNAIAQGYSVDVICRYFDGLGIKSYCVEIGGEVRVKGKKAGKPWRIGIDKPVDDNMIPGSDLEAIVRLNDRALSTSGNYRKFYIENYR